MCIHIIHLRERTDRYLSFIEQLTNQKITEYKIWDGVMDSANRKRGIAKAHKQIVSWARTQSLNEITIAEDDVLFTAKDSYTYYTENAPDEFDLYLGGIMYGNIQNGIVEDFAGLHFYTIRARFYDLFLAASEESDIDRNLKGKGLFKVCSPFIAIQDNGYSDNNCAYQNYDSYIKTQKCLSELK